MHSAVIIENETPNTNPVGNTRISSMNYINLRDNEWTSDECIDTRKTVKTKKQLQNV